MKILFSILSLLLFFTCTESNTQTAVMHAKKVNMKTEDLTLEVTFDKGPLAGTHRFTKIPDNYVSNIAIGYYDASDDEEQLRNTSNVNANNLISEDGRLVLEYMIRSYQGETTKGIMPAIAFKNIDGAESCGKLKIRDENSSYAFHEIRGDFMDCTSTAITALTEWKAGTIKNRRMVAGHFKDQISLEFQHDDDSVEEIKVSINLQFRAQETRMKKK